MKNYMSLTQFNTASTRLTWLMRAAKAKAASGGKAKPAAGKKAPAKKPGKKKE